MVLVLLIPEVWGHDYMRHKDKAPPLGRNEYPDLRHASDIIYGLMMSAIRMYSVPWNGTKTIEHIIIWGITNDELNGVIGNIITDVQRCLRSDGRYKNRVEKVPSPLLWPGIEVDVEGQYGSWLLGTRLGKTVARFLSQHKYLLRHKLTTRAIIFQQVLSANAMPYSVYFQVLDKAYYGSRKPKVSWTLLNQGYE